MGYTLKIMTDILYDLQTDSEGILLTRALYRSMDTIIM